MIKLQQDPDGFVRMPTIVPNSARITVVFADGTQEEFTGQRLNDLRAEALAGFRKGNNMDAKGFNRNKGQVKHGKNSVQFVPVAPGMSQKPR
ncbi:hypothetical protein [Paeniglutamicibacter cryotolerans]|uniref:Uncharacterized protein n=1 Tax=Paeniglutamicibacter cryotolerans TaxID=670079 RepID=A0A839QS11_9MICC|nr:hypothetical protein [Paeniglutamicibacter cryotolerans]MBB2996756.1 hypothetical protein [Paeniglutamicibacter cryotolerans]